MDRNSSDVLLFHRVFQVIEFSPATIAAFIAMVGILSIVAQVHKEPADAILEDLLENCWLSENKADNELMFLIWFSPHREKYKTSDYTIV